MHLSVEQECGWGISRGCVRCCLIVQQEFIGASLSEPHTSGTALRTCVCMFACLLACLLVAIYRKFSNERG